MLSSLNLLFICKDMTIISYNFYFFSHSLNFIAYHLLNKTNTYNKNGVLTSYKILLKPSDIKPTH